MAEQKLSGSQFASCCYCLLNIETLDLTIARGGHPFPVLIRAGVPNRLQVQGPLLGVFEDAEFEQESVRLQSGDKLLLYSDGAERLIGHFNQLEGFVFEQSFCELTTLPVKQLNEQFNLLLQSPQTSDYEVDDVTAVWLEIL
jgi:serine phosphatase RsbU (regulator of sigma subunit)